jgi:V8-like Glu-specific endopeptidase
MSIPPTQNPPTQQVAIDALNFSVTLIIRRCHGEAPQQTIVGSATGFFFVNNDRRYLITNKHVVVDQEHQIYPDNLVIRVHTSPTSTVQNREITIPLYDSSNHMLWLEHQDSTVDVVAIPIDNHIQSGDAIHYLSSRDMPPPNLLLTVQDNCMIVGYPAGFYDNIHNLPITRVGTIASPYRAHFQNQRFFLLDATLHPGTSGSPVILPPTTSRRTIDGTNIGVGLGYFPYRLLGINSGEYSSAGAALGLHRVWYSNLIQEILPAPSPPTTPATPATPPIESQPQQNDQS